MALLRTRKSALAAFRSFSTACGANAAIEFALVIPVMLLFMGGIVEIGRAYQVYGAVNQLATRYAAAWADCSDAPPGTCNTELSLYTGLPTLQNLAPQLTASAISLRMMQVVMSSDGTSASVTYAYPAGATSLLPGEIAVAKAALASGQTGVVVTVSYNHTLVFFQQVLAMTSLGPSRLVSYSVAQQKS